MNKRLGKGIGALIRNRELDKDEYLDGFVNIENIQTNPDQPRKYFDEKSLNELVDSIREKGILQPITVKSLSEGKFELIAGERRFRAAQILKLKAVPAYVIDVASDAEKLELALVENIQRNDLNVIEEAEAYCVLKEKYGLTHEQIAKKVGKGRVEITRTMELIKLPDNIKEELIANSNNTTFSFSRGHARTILGLKDPIKIQTLFNRILKENLSVRKTEQIVKNNNNGSKIRNTLAVKAASVLKDEELLSSLLAAKIEVSKKNNNSGHIKILFKSDEDRARIIDIIESIKKIK
tara:strand:- start:443 stop:1324 length:882 start_codon:yes stop_codon:yes gene_type:complete